MKQNHVLIYFFHSQFNVISEEKLFVKDVCVQKKVQCAINIQNFPTAHMKLKREERRKTTKNVYFRRQRERERREKINFRVAE
jgi:hypothetical protein